MGTWACHPSTRLHHSWDLASCYWRLHRALHARLHCLQMTPARWFVMGATAHSICAAPTYTGSPLPTGIVENVPPTLRHVGSSAPLRICSCSLSFLQVTLLLPLGKLLRSRPPTSPSQISCTTGVATSGVPTHHVGCAPCSWKKPISPITTLEVRSFSTCCRRSTTGLG